MNLSKILKTACGFIPMLWFLKMHSFFFRGASKTAPTKNQTLDLFRVCFLKNQNYTLGFYWQKTKTEWHFTYTSVFYLKIFGFRGYISFRGCHLKKRLRYRSKNRGPYYIGYVFFFFDRLHDPV